MKKQRKIANNLGFDTHLRKDYSTDKFKTQSYESYQFVIGEIEMVQPEPIFKQNMVQVKIARGGRISSVAYPGAFIDPITGNLHGLYEGPYPGQMVTVGFENGNQASPMVINKYPYQGVANTLFELQYINPQTKKGFHNFDIVMGHFSGSYVCLNTGIAPNTSLPGSITINAITDCDIISPTYISLDSGITTKVYGTTSVELNGNTNFAVTWTELNSALQSLVTSINATFATKKDEAGTAGTLTLDLSSAKNTKVLM